MKKMPLSFFSISSVGNAGADMLLCPSSVTIPGTGSIRRKQAKRLTTQNRKLIIDVQSSLSKIGLRTDQTTA